MYLYIYNMHMKGDHPGCAGRLELHPAYHPLGRRRPDNNMI